MPPRKQNPLIALAKKIPQEVDAFAVAYDASANKESFLLCLGDVMQLRKDNHEMYCNMLNDLGISEKVEEEAEEHIRLYHSTQNGVNKITDIRRIHAIIKFLSCKYVDVSFIYR